MTTVLFGDLVGFTLLAESRDPEEVRELLSRYFDAARTVVMRYGGVVEKFIGDAVMAVWGVPIAHEDDAERAVRAALELIDAVSELGETVGPPGLALRVGVVTGEVAVTLGATGEGMVAGDAVNTAARVQSAAVPGEVWVDEETRSMTSAAVGYDAAGEHQLKGKSEPMRLYCARQVVGNVGGSRRVDGLEAPLVGRDRELRLIKELFHATLEEGRPRLVGVVGQAGIGKSRVGWEFYKYSDGIRLTVRWHRGRCLSYGDGVAFWALAEIVRSRLGVVEGDSSATVVNRLLAGLEEYVADQAERTWLLPRMATLLGVAEPVGASGTYAREDLFAAWRTFLERLAAGAADGAVLVIEDLQWADAGLLDFLDHVLLVARAPIFILALARAELLERRPAFGTGRRANSIYLEPLAEPAMHVLVDGLVAGVPADVRAALVRQADGVPLYAVETVRSLIDRNLVVPREGRYVLAPGAAEQLDLGGLALPTSLHTLIAARLDALPAEERRLVQDAAVLGLSFTREGLAALATATAAGPGSAAEVVSHVDRGLGTLVAKEIFSVESDPRSPERGQFHFVQALVRGVAYETMSRRDRKLRHLAVAAHLGNETDADAFPAVLASHYLDARAAAPTDPDADELARQGVALLERAAVRASALGAPAEARRHYETALGLVTAEEAVGRLAEGAAESARLTGEQHIAAALAERSRAAYLAAGRPVDAARALAVWADALIAAGSGDQTTAVLSAAYAEIVNVPGADQIAGRLALSAARSRFVSAGDPAGSLDWFDRAVVLGERANDQALVAGALASYGGALILTGRSTMGLGLIRVALDTARAADKPQAELRALNNLVAFLALRDLRSARGYADEALARVRQLGNRDIGLFIATNAVYVMWCTGEWEAAIALYDELWGPEGEDSATALSVLGYLAQIALARGLPAVGAERLSVTLEGDDAQSAVWRLLLAAVAAESRADLKESARAAVQAADGYARAGGFDDDFPLFWVYAVEASVRAEDHASARRLVELVGQSPPAALAPYVRAQLPRLRALVDAAEGRDETVEPDLVAAERALRAFGAPFAVARTLLERAEWLAARGRGAEAAPARVEAHQIFRDLGATPWSERAAADPVAAGG